MTWLSNVFRSGRGRVPAWTYSPGATVWRMLPTEQGTLVGEARDEVARKVSFFALDLESGRVLWEGRTVQEDWWVGIELVHRDRVLLHTFARPDMPEPAGIVALDMGSGEMAWSEPRWRIRSVRGDDILVTDPDRDDGALTVLSARSGEVRGKAEDMSSGLAAEAGVHPEPSDVAYPVQFGEGSAEWSALMPHLKGRQMVGLGEGVEVDGRRIFSYHSSLPGGSETRTLEHRIIVIDARGRRVFTDLLHQKAHMPVYDAFFVRAGKAYYVRRESELVCLDLGPGEHGS